MEFSAFINPDGCVHVFKCDYSLVKPFEGKVKLKLIDIPNRAVLAFLKANSLKSLLSKILCFLTWLKHFKDKSWDSCRKLRCERRKTVLCLSSDSVSLACHCKVTVPHCSSLWFRK